MNAFHIIEFALIVVPVVAGMTYLFLFKKKSFDKSYYLLFPLGVVLVYSLTTSHNISFAIDNYNLIYNTLFWFAYCLATFCIISVKKPIRIIVFVLFSLPMVGSLLSGTFGIIGVGMSTEIPKSTMTDQDNYIEVYSIGSVLSDANGAKAEIYKLLPPNGLLKSYVETKYYKSIIPYRNPVEIKKLHRDKYILTSYDSELKESFIDTVTIK